MTDFKPTICIDWRPITGWPYEVSDHGAVRRSQNRRLLRPSPDKNGYPCVTLCAMPKIQTFKVHVLVCCTFNGPPPEGADQVRHLDGCPTNNSPGNLCWGTAAENAEDRERHGRQGQGETSARAKFTQAEVDNLRRDHAAALVGRQRVPRGWCQNAAAHYGVSPITISCIVGGRGYV
jgi:hypothetical protein